MKRTKSFMQIQTLIVLLACSFTSYGQCNDTLFFDDFSQSTGRITESTGKLSIKNGKCSFNGSTDRSFDRTFQVLDASLDTGYWKYETSFKIIAQNPSYIGTHLIVSALTKGTQHFELDEITNKPTNQDGIAIYFDSDVDTDNDLNKTAFMVKVKKGTNLTTSSKIYASSGQFQYFLRLERIAPGKVRLSIFKDAKFLNAFGTPVEISVDETVTELNTLQHGVNVIAQVERRINAEIDDDYLCIYNKNKLSVPDNLTWDKYIATYPNPTHKVFNLVLPNVLATNLTYQIIDFSGRIAMEGIMLDALSLIDVSKLNTGIYTINIQADQQNFKTKFVKQ